MKTLFVSNNTQNHLISVMKATISFTIFNKKGFPDSSVGKEFTCNAGEPSLIPGVRKICWSRDRLPTSVFLDFPCGSAGTESACNAGDLGSTPGLGRSTGERKGYPLFRNVF